jgi:hypothetical protein
MDLIKLIITLNNNKMKNSILILFFSVAFLSNINANNSISSNFDDASIELIQNDEINTELINMLKDGTIKSLTISYDEYYDCTLSAELSYNGVAIKVSITADDCEKAGAGLAQAVKGFYKEVAKQ